jgi:hypothetical protein
VSPPPSAHPWEWHQRRRELLMQLAMTAGASLFGPPALGAARFQSQLTESQRAMVAQLAELIIPTTDTPGAIAAGVPAFIDHIVSTWCTPKERAIFAAGLTALDAFCQAQYGCAFTACDARQRELALADAEQRARGYRSPAGGSIFSDTDEDAPFFYKLKQLTVLGYYTSEVGGTQELRYEPVPGRYDGDVDFNEIGREWSA